MKSCRREVVADLTLNHMTFPFSRANLEIFLLNAYEIIETPVWYRLRLFSELSAMPKTNHV